MDLRRFWKYSKKIQVLGAHTPGTLIHSIQVDKGILQALQQYSFFLNSRSPIRVPLFPNLRTLHWPIAGVAFDDSLFSYAPLFQSPKLTDLHFVSFENDEGSSNRAHSTFASSPS